MPLRQILPILIGLVVAASAGCADEAGDADRPPQTSGKLVFTSDRDNPPPQDEELFGGLERFELYAVDVPGGRPERLTKNTTVDLNPACSPDGKTVAFTSGGPERTSVYLMNVDGSDRRRLTESPSTDFSPSWSPEGDEIVIARAQGSGDSDLYIVDVDSGEARLLVGGGANDAWPAWSPEGDRIAFVRSGDPSGLYVTSATRDDPERLLRNVDEDRLAWSPDGDELAFSRTVGGFTAIWVIEVETRRLRKLTRAELGSENPQASPAWSPDGETIAFAETAGIAIVGPDGSGSRGLRLGPDLFTVGGKSRGWVEYTEPTWCG